MGVVYNQIVGSNTLYTDNPSVLTAAVGALSGATINGANISTNNLVQGWQVPGIDPALNNNWYMKITTITNIPPIANNTYNFNTVTTFGSTVASSSGGGTYSGLDTTDTPTWWGTNIIIAEPPKPTVNPYGTPTLPFNPVTVTKPPISTINYLGGNDNVINLTNQYTPPGMQNSLISTSSLNGNNTSITTVSPYQTFTTPTGSITASSTGLLPPSTQVVVAPITIPTNVVGTLPPNISITTPTGTVTTTPTGMLPPNTVVTTPIGVVTTGPTGILPGGTVVITPSRTITVNEDGTLPEGTVLTVPINGFTIPPELGNIVGKRLLVNEYYVGIVTGYTSSTISVNAPNGMDIRPLNGIWRMEVTDNVGRAPICVVTQIAVSNWAAYPILDVDGKNYGEAYATSVTYSPEYTEVFANRNDTQTTNVVLRHEFPAWVEHAHLLGDGTYELAEDPNIDTDMPYIAYYVRNWPDWQWGRVVTIYKDAVETYTGNLAGFINAPGRLFAPEDSVVSRITDKIHIATELSGDKYYRDTLATIATLEVAMSPTAINYNCTVVERTINAVSECYCTLVEKTGNTDINNINLYYPEDAWLLDYRSNLYGINVLEFAAPKVELIVGITSTLAPIVGVEIPVLQIASAASASTTILFKRGIKANLPSSAAVGEPLVTLDTAELFIGTGTGLRKISDVIVSETEPAVEDQSKLWYNPVAKTTSVYKDGSWQLTESNASIDYGEF